MGARTPCHTLRRSLPCSPMSNESEPLGVCPECGDEIHPYQVLVEYETEEGETDRFVECYSCDEVVRPE